MPIDSSANTRPIQVESLPETPFYVSATGPTSRPRRALKHGDTFVVLDHHGDIGAVAGGSDGLFHADTRFLSRLELLLNGGFSPLDGFQSRADYESVLSDMRLAGSGLLWPVPITLEVTATFADQLELGQRCSRFRPRTSPGLLTAAPPYPRVAVPRRSPCRPRDAAR